MQKLFCWMFKSELNSRAKGSDEKGSGVSLSKQRNVSWRLRVTWLRLGELSPDVEHENGGDEKQWHHQHWNWSTKILYPTMNIFFLEFRLKYSHFDAGAVVSVESPHAAWSSSSSVRARRCCGGRGCLSLPNVSSSWRWSTAAGTRRWGFWADWCWWRWWSCL